jgi:hypothetical protein
LQASFPPGGGAVVPEPATVLTLFAGLALLMTCRARRKTGA